jgi:type I restriction enzyme S subunit
MKLLDICKIGGKSVKKYQGLKKYVATGDVINNAIASFKNVSYENKPSRANVEIDGSDVLFAKMKDTIKTLCANTDNINNIYSTGFYVLKPTNNVIQKYLYYYLNSESFNAQKNRLCSGATQKALNNEGLDKIIIKDIPTIVEQEKIIERLTIIDNLINLKNNQINKLELLVKSQFVNHLNLRGKL